MNGEQCDDESHEEVIRQIKVAPSPLKLLVVRDPRMRVHAKKVTQALLGEEHTYVMNDSTNIPRRNSRAPLHFVIDVLADPVPLFPCAYTVADFTVEMTEAPLGRTKMLQERYVFVRTFCLCVRVK